MSEKLYKKVWTKLEITSLLNLIYICKEKTYGDDIMIFSLFCVTIILSIVNNVAEMIDGWQH